ncbi:MAG: hypothetical protein L3J63_10935 [Geopsychrobacter sp.]|nr:hypothetical protein [Geopsychrobacter sp.]
MLQSVSPPVASHSADTPLTTAGLVEVQSSAPVDETSQTLRRSQNPQDPAEDTRGTQKDSVQISAEAREIAKLAARDTEVRVHESAHAAVGGRYAGSPSLTYTRGLDGRSYATDGEVSIDISPVSGDPQATIDKAQIVRAAALAPAEPSGQDRQVAASASALEVQARAELLTQTAAPAGRSTVDGQKGSQRSSEDNSSDSIATTRRHKPVSVTAFN